jgi:large subunit ribosomal protein L9
MMKIILQEDVPHLGVVGDLVSVRDGYARNYLIPQGKAVFASIRSIKELEHQRRIADHKRQQATAEAEVAKRKVEELSVTLQAKVAPPQYDDDGKPIPEDFRKLFGSVTHRDIAKVLRDAGVKVDHRRVVLAEPVRAVGRYVARVRLDGGIEAQLPFYVVPENTEDVELEKARIDQAVERRAAEEAERKAAAAAPAPAPTEDEARAETESSEADAS